MIDPTIPSKVTAFFQTVITDQLCEMYDMLLRGDLRQAEHLLVTHSMEFHTMVMKAIRFKNASTFWLADNVEKLYFLRAALVAGRWNIVRDNIAKSFYNEGTNRNCAPREFMQNLAKDAADYPRLKPFFVDGNYRYGKFMPKDRPHWELRASKIHWTQKHPSWIVERTFAWLGNSRRLLVGFGTSIQHRRVLFLLQKFNLSMPLWSISFDNFKVATMSNKQCIPYRQSERGMSKHFGRSTMTITRSC